MELKERAGGKKAEGDAGRKRESGRQKLDRAARSPWLEWSWHVVPWSALWRLTPHSPSGRGRALETIGCPSIAFLADLLLPLQM